MSNKVKSAFYTSQAYTPEPRPIVGKANKNEFCKNCSMIIVERRFPDKCCGYRMIWVHVWNSNAYCRPSAYAEPGD